jgi:hypothetical protein
MILFRTRDRLLEIAVNSSRALRINTTLGLSEESLHSWKLYCDILIRTRLRFGIWCLNRCVGHFVNNRSVLHLVSYLSFCVVIARTYSLTWK